MYTGVCMGRGGYKYTMCGMARVHVLSVLYIGVWDGECIMYMYTGVWEGKGI